MGSSKRGSGRAVKSSRSEVGIQAHNALWRVTLRQERAQPSTSAPCALPPGRDDLLERSIVAQRQPVAEVVHAAPDVEPLTLRERLFQQRNGVVPVCASEIDGERGALVGGRSQVLLSRERGEPRHLAF